ncbi:MAG: TetR/AcrR family transcriptional regulator [Gammaproteobacteria bacterium]|nr:TetR/AcrR family transcriptional regulator [Gammaproteobacteria bacterium]
MAKTVNIRDTLLEQLVPVFREQGYEGATLVQLAAATGLGKASLYHHFPGGKAEMAAVLLRKSVAELQKRAFAHLTRSKRAPIERLEAFVDGFSDYVAEGAGHCLVAVFTQGSAAGVHGDLINNQFGDWRNTLIAVFEELGEKHKRACRSADQLLDELYGGLLTAKLLGDPNHFTRCVKRIKKALG